MTRRRVLSFIFVALAALLAALWLRRPRAGVVEEVPPGQVASEAPATAASRVEPVAGATTIEAPSRKSEGPLHGLRLLPESVALERGWVPPPPDLLSAKYRQVAERLQGTLFTLNYTETTLDDVIRDMGDRYGVAIKLDPGISGEDKTVTFKVQELAADQAIDLILKMADLAYRVDENGIIWIVTKESVQDTNPVWREVSAVQWKMIVPQRMDDHIAEWLAGHTATVSIEFEDLDVAIKVLLDEGGLSSSSWSAEAAKVAENFREVTLVGSDLQVGPAIQGLLKPVGLALSWAGGGLRVVTQAEHDGIVAQENERARVRAEDDADLEAIMRCRVRIDGACLSLKYIAAQISAQLGQTVRIDPHYDDRVHRWESDDLEQSVGEILGIVGRDADLKWHYTSPRRRDDDPPPDLPADPPPRKELWLLEKDW